VRFWRVCVANPPNMKKRGCLCAVTTAVVAVILGNNCVPVWGQDAPTARRRRVRIDSNRRRSASSSSSSPFNDTAIDPSTHSYIVNGIRAKTGEFPSFAYPKSTICGATLIWKDVLLTAAHCDWGFVPNQPVYIGGTFMDGRNAEETKLIDWILPHPSYSECDKVLKGDIMLVFLKSASSVEHTPINTVTANPVVNQVLTLYGHGVTANGDPSLNLLKANLNVVDTNDCAASFGQASAIFVPEHVCTSARPESACFGDSGGPLVGQAGYLVGVVSGGSGDCVAPTKPNRYTRVSTYTDWIQHALCHYSASPPPSTTCTRYLANPCTSGRSTNDGTTSKETECFFFGAVPGVRVHGTLAGSDTCTEQCHPLIKSTSKLKRGWACGPCRSSTDGC
jgi:Trypsin